MRRSVKRSERRREWRSSKRNEMRGVNARVDGDEECVIVTWNVQRLSMREHNRRRLRRVCERVVKEKWEIVLLTELSADESGVVWLGEHEEECAIVHAKKSGVLLRGGALRRWIEEGQQKWFGERVTAVVFGGVRMVSVYQPIWGMDEEGMERYKRELESQVAIGGKERLVIGGDFNASVGKNVNRVGVCGKYGIGRMNEAGRDLVEWCEQHELAYVNSYMKHARRGTWFHMRYGRWYELDGFIVRKNERHGHVRKMWTVNDGVLSDHRPKCMKLRVRSKKWRVEGGNARRVPRIKWEVMKEEEKKREYERRTRELVQEESKEEVKDEWKKMTKVMMQAAREVCGVVTREVANPWTVGREEEVESLQQRVKVAVRERNEKVRVWNARLRLRARRGDRERELEVERAREKVKNVRKDLKRFLRRAEREWWNERIRECEEASATGRVGDMYKCLRKIGTRGKPAGRSVNVTAQEFKEHFEMVSKDRYEEDPGLIEEAVRRAKDLRENEKAKEANELMNERPEREEIVKAMNDMHESAPGEDGVRIGFIREACAEVRERVIEVVQSMFECRADRWDESLKVGVMVPLHKKGDRNDRNNYRGVCLLTMGSRVVARVIAKRLAWWAEHLELFDENQAGFRKGRSTADVVQMMVRMEEDVVDCKRRMQASDSKQRLGEDEWPCARLLDLRKAYPRVNKPALWMLLERYGLKGRCLETVMDLHETTEYKVRGREGMSEAWLPARGLREGCSTSPVLFNVYHQAVMRQAEEQRERENGRVGVKWKWIPGGSFAGESSWERGCTEAKSVRITSALFADDTTIVGVKGEIEEGVRVVKNVMSKWEERNNEDKEEVLEFGTEEGSEIRVLGSWVGMEADVRQRIRRAGMLWARVKGWLNGSRMSKRCQGRVVEACVESSMLYDCQARVWYKKDIKRVQKWMDKCYRYVWSDRKGQPLRQMSERGVNMTDVRVRLGVKSVAWKIERRVLERIGHVMRMGNERLTKAMVLGWYEKLEGKSKMLGRKRKTVLYWKRVMKEAGLDWTDVERLTSDREEWKSRVGERMEHLYNWECQKGHKYEWRENEERMERKARSINVLECRYEGCGKVCKSRAGLTIHEKRMHRVAEERVRFECEICREVFETEGAKKNHARTCMGGARGMAGRRECGRCGSWVTKGNYARHVRGCVGGDDREDDREDDRVRGRMKVCEVCGRAMSRANMARHQRGCRVWDPGGEPRP
jgi:hypothetical protein